MATHKRATKIFFRVLTSTVALVVPVALLLMQQQAPASKALDWSRLYAWGCCLIGLISLMAVAGYEVRGRVWGVLIDERNRYSLSRLQISLWTVLVLASLYVVFIANTVRGTASFEALNVNIDPNLVVLMGFSIASFVAAPLALSRKADQSASAEELDKANRNLVPTQNLSMQPSTVGRLLVKGAAADARLADLIKGEEVGNASVIDLPRTQMLLITLVVVTAYGAAMFSLLRHGDWLLDKLPVLSQTLLLLILVSHGGYLVGKLVPTANSGSGPTAEQLSRALVASQKASELVAELRLLLAQLAATDSRRNSIEANLSLAQILASDAAQLPTRISTSSQAEEISVMEGRIDVLQASTRMLAEGQSQLMDAPAAEIVEKVQRKLAALGYSVRATGTPDAETEKAISTWMTSAGVSRSYLHPDRMRYYEELAQLI